MSTNRPFMANFFAAFRAHSAIQKVATTTPTAAPGSASSTSYTHNSSIHTTSNSASPNASSNPRPINNKNGTQGAGATTAAVHATGQFQPSRQHAPSPYSRSPTSPGFPLKSPKQRRGSDSSSEGFRETMGADRWYIGGRTASGEEKFYPLGMVKSHKSIDRLSIDRLSI